MTRGAGVKPRWVLLIKCDRAGWAGAPFRRDRDRASWASVLRLWPVSKSRIRAASLAGTSATCSPDSSSRCARGGPTPLAPSTAQTRCGQACAHRCVAGLIGGKPPRAKQLFAVVDDLDRGRQLVGIPWRHSDRADRG